MGGMSLPYFQDLSFNAWMAHGHAAGLTPVQCRRIFRQVHATRGTDWDAIDIPPRQRERVRRDFELAPLPRVADQRLATDGTVKFLFAMADGRTVEAVYIPEEDRGTVCLSSQVGCAMGCTFCFTAQMGLIRNLAPHEILGQFKLVRAALPGMPLTNIVFMGMGEPLHNLDNLLAALQALTNDFGLGFPARRITVSTSGLLPAMRTLLEETSVRLALSVNGPNAAKRRKVMPVERAWPIETVLAEMKLLSAAKGNHHQLMYEYVMLGGENDGEEDARDLVELLDGIPGRVNLIPFNAHPGSPFKRPDEAAVLRFHRYLRDAGVHVFIRRSRGDDVLAACGQLNHENLRPAKRRAASMPA
jgi:23S rRNA (adenine2503-C2)-methyltransferase